MNVTGIEWRDLDPHEPRPGGRGRRRPPPKADEAAEVDVVEIHVEEDETPHERAPEAGDLSA